MIMLTLFTQVTLRLTFPSAYNTDSAVQALPFNGQIRVLARGYNVMRIVSGMMAFFRRFNLILIFNNIYFCRYGR